MTALEPIKSVSPRPIEVKEETIYRTTRASRPTARVTRRRQSRYYAPKEEEVEETAKGHGKSQNTSYTPTPASSPTPPLNNDSQRTRAVPR